MRRLFAAGSLLAVALLLSACAANQSPNWTYAPPTVAPSANPSAAASGEASAPASTAPSAEASGGGATGAVVDITAQGIKWTTPDVSAAANTAFKIHFDNQDASTMHNIDIKNGSGEEVLKTDFLTGVAQADYDVKPLPAGTYTFICDVHPAMQGTLTVK